MVSNLPAGRQNAWLGPVHAADGIRPGQRGMRTGGSCHPPSFLSPSLPCGLQFAFPIFFMVEKWAGVHNGAYWKRLLCRLPIGQLAGAAAAAALLGAWRGQGQGPALVPGHCPLH